MWALSNRLRVALSPGDDSQRKAWSDADPCSVKAWHGWLQGKYRIPPLLYVDLPRLLFSLLVPVLYHPGVWRVTAAQAWLSELMPPLSPAPGGQAQSGLLRGGK